MAIRSMSIRSIADKKIHIISDPEGFKIPDVPEGEELYICGDLVDSVIKGKNNFLPAKSHNLHNIRECITKDNVFLAFGNRDLNKIKCKWLCELKKSDDPQNILVRLFNNGSIMLNYESYKSIVALEPEWVHNHKNWYPYWNATNAIFLPNYKDKTDQIGRAHV